MLIPLLAGVALMQNPMEFAQLSRAIESDPANAARTVRGLIPGDQLKRGADPRDQGRRVLFAIEVEGAGEHQVTVESGDKVLAELRRLEGGLYAAVKEFGEGDAFPAEYRVDGKTVRGGLQVEVYDINPYVLAPAGGRKGELRDMGELRSTTYPGTTRKWYVYLPPNLDPNQEHPVLIATDAQWDRDWIANGLENSAKDGVIPATVGIFIEPGQDRPGNYSNRSREYDALSPSYTQFLLEEILPQVEKIVKLSQDPAKRALTGMSSGGICSFTACWERPDKFGVALSFIGSFANIASGPTKREGGHNYPFLIRKSEKKPIRVYLQDGSNDLDNEHGSWWVCNLQMISALRFKGYDAVWMPGKGFHNTKHARRVFDQALRWWLGPPVGVEKSPKPPVENSFSQPE